MITNLKKNSAFHKALVEGVEYKIVLIYFKIKIAFT